MAGFWGGTTVEFCGWTGLASRDSSSSVFAEGKGERFGSSLRSTGAKTAVIGPRGLNGSVERESSVVTGAAFVVKGMVCDGGGGSGLVAPNLATSASGGTTA